MSQCVNTNGEGPLISVVIPIYNALGRLDKLVDSLQRQTYRNLEVIFCDDASTDGVQDYLSGLSSSKTFDHMQILLNDANRGAAYTRNLGIRVASGEYVVMPDADDLLESNFVSALYDKVRGGLDYAFCGFKKLELATGEFDPHPLKMAAHDTQEEILLGRIFNKYEIQHWAGIYKREYLIQNSIFYTDGCIAGEDMEFLLRVLSLSARAAFISDCLYTYVQHDRMGSRMNVHDEEMKLARYASHTEAQFREANYVLRIAKTKKLRNVALYMMLPAAWQRRLSVKAMRKDPVGFDDLRVSYELRSALGSSWRSFFYKPEVFLRSCFAMLLPKLYYKKYSHYCTYCKR